MSKTSALAAHSRAETPFIDIAPPRRGTPDRVEGEVPTWLRWARRMQALAQSGLAYAHDPFDIERYEALHALATEVVAAHSGLRADMVHALFAGDTGYATPKLDVRGVVFREDGALLLVRERSDGCWAPPGGWVDVGDSPTAAAEREIWEESGYRVRATKVLAVLDRDRHGHPPMAHHSWKLFLRCTLIGGTASATGPETDDVGFFHIDAIPPLSLMRVVPSQIARLFEHYAHPEWPTDVD